MQNNQKENSLMQKEQTQKSKSYNLGAIQVLNDIWSSMLITYPRTWEMSYTNDPLDKQGYPTALALSWIKELKGLTKKEIMDGLNNLSSRTEKAFPPNAMEFRELCTGSDYENVLDAIMCRFQAGNNYKWTNQLAFNFWQMYSFDLQNGNKYDVPKLIKQNLKLIDKSSMFPLPDYSKPAIEKPKQQKGIAPKSERQAFQSVMHGAIFRHKPQLFEEPEEHKKQKFVSSDINSSLPPLMQKIFSPAGTTELINKFKDSGYIMPDKPIRLGFMEFSKTEWAVKYKAYKSKAIEAMTNFLTEQGIMT